MLRVNIYIVIKRFTIKKREDGITSNTAGNAAPAVNSEATKKQAVPSEGRRPLPPP